jgi:threonine dehydrogenase-like Zn-dependent dehydrogenase
MSMRAVRNTENGVAVVDVPTPDGPGMRVRVRAAGICGSDLEMVANNIIMTTIGHEFAGVLDDGTEVAVQPFAPCGECDLCQSGAMHMCRRVADTMYGVFVDGGMADEIVVDPSCASPLAPGVRVEDASLVEPLAVSLHACHRAGIGSGMRVGVVGAGTIGLLSALVAKHLGADVSVGARHDSQRIALEKLGITSEPARGCDVVIEAAGTASAFDDAVKRVRRQGTIALVSTTWNPIEISFLGAQMKEATLIPAFIYGEAPRADAAKPGMAERGSHGGGTREFDAAAALLAVHPEIPDALITHRFGLDEAAHAFQVAADRAAGTIKVVLHP